MAQYQVVWHGSEGGASPTLVEDDRTLESLGSFLSSTGFIITKEARKASAGQFQIGRDLLILGPSVRMLIPQ